MKSKRQRTGKKHKSGKHPERKPEHKSSGGFNPPSARGSRNGPVSRDSRGPGPSRRDSRHDSRRNSRRDSSHESRNEPSQPKDPAIIAAAEKSKLTIRKWLDEGEKLKSTPRPESEATALDPWQKQAVDALTAGKSIIVDAPTTAGKTRVVEAFFAQNIDRPEFRATYTTPVKSLSNDKLREFREMFGHNRVGIATGDIKENLSAPIVVATLESYRNSLLGTEPDLNRNCVVFDEYHFLQDDSRGSAWEESIILTPQSCQLVLLSASVENCQEFTDWINRIRKSPCELIQVSKRPVPLTDLIYCGDDWIVASEVPQRYLKNLDRQRMHLPLHQEKIAARLKKTLPLGLAPCIVYAGRRMSCENLAYSIAKELEPLSPKESEAIGVVLEKAHKEMKALSFIKPQLRQLLQIYGVGFHHSGLAPSARVCIEWLVKAGLLRFCVATMGLSVGINFAVRSALISDYERPGSTGFTEYGSSEVLQMLGRAGRRGNDICGFSLWPNVESYTRLKPSHRELCNSRLRSDPTTFLGLIGQGYDLDAIYEFYEKSFRSYSSAKGGHAVNRNVETLHRHLKNIGALTDKDQLTEFGQVAKYFPQAGGLYLTKLIVEKKLTAKNLLLGAELMGALSLARFKEPGSAFDYRFPFSAEAIEEELERFYPHELFPELYDTPHGRGNNTLVLREFNPMAGYLVREWCLKKLNWNELSARVTSAFFGPGDLMSVLYRSATYLQSTSQARLGDISRAAGALREEILREPLSFTIGRS